MGEVWERVERVRGEGKESGETWEEKRRERMTGREQVLRAKKGREGRGRKNRKRRRNWFIKATKIGRQEKEGIAEGEKSRGEW